MEFTFALEFTFSSQLYKLANFHKNHGRLCLPWFYHHWITGLLPTYLNCDNETSWCRTRSGIINRIILCLTLINNLRFIDIIWFWLWQNRCIKPQIFFIYCASICILPLTQYIFFLLLYQSIQSIYHIQILTFTYNCTAKSIEKEAEIPVFSRLHGVLNALGCSIPRPDISLSNCCHVSWRTSWLEHGQRNQPFTSMRLYRSTKPSFSHRSAFTLAST